MAQVISYPLLCDRKSTSRSIFTFESIKAKQMEHKRQRGNESWNESDKHYFQHLPSARRISFSIGVACTALSRAHICGSSSVIDSIALFIALFIAFRKWSTSFNHFSLKSFSLRKTKKNEKVPVMCASGFVIWLELLNHMAQIHLKSILCANQRRDDELADILMFFFRSLIRGRVLFRL